LRLVKMTCFTLYCSI